MLTVAVLNHNYGRFIERAILSAQEFADEVLVYDDGSTDDSLDVIASVSRCTARRDTQSGSPCWGSNQAIQDATGDFLLWLDADNYLIGRPEPRATYTYAPIVLCNGAGEQTGAWEYEGWPLTAWDGLKRFEQTHQMPVPAGGVWDLRWLRDNSCKWLEWPSTQMGADFRTMLSFLSKNPSLAYLPYPVLAFRQHATQSSNSSERALMEADALNFKGE